MGIRTGNPVWVDSATEVEAQANPGRKITAAKLNAIEAAIDDSAEAGHTHDAPVALDVSDNVALWVVSPGSSKMGGYSSSHNLFTSTLMPLTMTVYGLSIYCTTADTDATITLALYQGFSATNQVAQVTPPLAMPLSATGQVLVALPEPVTLSAGPLFIGYNTSGTTAQVRAGTSTYPLLRSGSSPWDYRQVRFINTNAPLLPSTLNIGTSSAPTSDSPPAVGLLAVAP